MTRRRYYDPAKNPYPRAGVKASEPLKPKAPRTPDDVNALLRAAEKRRRKDERRKGRA